MTLFSEKIVQRLQRAGDVRCYDWSPKNVPRGLRFRITRGWRVLQSMVMLLAAGRARNSRLYLASNYRAGLWLTMLLVALGRWLGYRVFVHHHTYRYIDQFDRRMAWICSLLGRRGIHIVACTQMEQDLRRRYPAASNFAHLNPSLVTGPIGTSRKSCGAVFTLGHLGNLSHAKGIDMVLDTFRILHGERNDVRLRLAGPFFTRQSQRLVKQALSDYPNHVDWSGPVFGDDKLRFLAGIDCFLFPTRSESWGIVLNEAMAAGVPVIAADRGCIRTVVGERAGVVVDREQDFAERAAEVVRHWLQTPDSYSAASRAAREQAVALQRQADQMLEEFVDQVLGGRARREVRTPSPA